MQEVLDELASHDIALLSETQKIRPDQDFELILGASECAAKYSWNSIDKILTVEYKDNQEAWRHDAYLSVENPESAMAEIASDAQQLLGAQ